MWKTGKEYDFGQVEERSIHEWTFEYIGDKIIDSAKGSCSCTAQKTNEKTVRVSYKAQAKDIYSDAEFDNITKSISVKFTDGSKEVLTIKAQVYGKPSTVEAIAALREQDKEKRKTRQQSTKLAEKVKKRITIDEILVRSLTRVSEKIENNFNLTKNNKYATALMYIREAVKIIANNE